MTGKGSKTRIVPMGEPAQRALERYLRPARPALAAEPRRAGAVPVAPRPAPVALRRPAPAGALGARGGRRRARLAAHPAPLVRDPSARGRRRSALDPGASRATPASRRPRCTRASSRSGCAASTHALIRALERATDKFSGSGTTMETNVKAVELRELWRRYKEQGDERARERLVVAYSPLVKFIAGRMASGPALARRGGRPDLLRPARPDRGDRALRSRARDQVRDLRRRPGQGGDHRRAPLARLGAALGARPGPRRRAGARRARGGAAARAHRRGDGRASSR